MTSQPPTGPPSGPLSPPPPPGAGPGPGPDDGSGRGPSGRRSPRNLVLIAVGTAMVVALGLVVLLRAVGGDDPAGGSSTPAGTGATTTPQATQSYGAPH